MQNLVNKLASERKAHLDTIENLTLKEIKQIVSRIRLPTSEGILKIFLNSFSYFLATQILHSKKKNRRRNSARGKVTGQGQLEGRRHRRKPLQLTAHYET